MNNTNFWENKKMKVDITILNSCPDIMNKEQMRKACHISKRTALYLLQYNLIPNMTTGKKTRCYKIKKTDIIAFLLDREVNPDKYIAPENWYKYGNDAVKPYKIRILPDAIPDDTYLRTFYEQKLMSFPDVFDVHRAVEFTGYNVRTVHQWIRTQKLKALNMNYKYMIPKCYFLDWLCSPEYNSTNRKSKAHVNMLWEVSESLKKLSVHSKNTRAKKK